MYQAGITSESITHRKEEYLRIWKKGPLQKQALIESGFPRHSSSFSCRWSGWEQCRAPRRRPQRRRGGRAGRARREPRLGSSGARNRCRLLLRTNSTFGLQSSDDPRPLYCHSEHFVETCSFTKPYIDRWFQYFVEWHCFPTNRNEVCQNGPNHTGWAGFPDLFILTDCHSFVNLFLGYRLSRWHWGKRERLARRECDVITSQISGKTSECCVIPEDLKLLTRTIFRGSKSFCHSHTTVDRKLNFMLHISCVTRFSLVHKKFL